MKIYKLTAKNEDLKNAPSLYFQEQRTAIATIRVFSAIGRKDKKIDWECEIIDVMSHDEAFRAMKEQGEKFFAE